ncbi:MAG: 30S ribosomal protein S21 [Candidatus Doudnabacteria bacterium]|nr:30S ribosomal protein S21 [Candidatus Doudnabacteria bacterium]
MAVIVHDDMPVDQALRMLWREANREGVIEKLKEIRYYVKPTSIKHTVKRAYAKTKRRRARAKRRAANKGH